MISGQRHSGKTTVTNIIKRILNEHKVSNINIALAEPIKQIGNMIANDNINLWSDDNGKKEYVERLGMTRRDFMMKFGTDFMHKFNENVWCEIAYERMVNRPRKVYIIEDVRMKHEYDYFASRANEFNNVISIKTIGNPANFDDIAIDHKSENQIDLIHSTIEFNTEDYDKQPIADYLLLTFKDLEIIT